ncbi:hypothetical protein SDC9_124684 [bioreactor metagenome]|uniref:Uncharacterized protein n=1 Tax=bioreactor metagenome TaxID=1076179 RepID=A0A645CL35_9ZZZZ
MAREHLAHAEQARQSILQLCQLNLQFTLTGLRPLRKNVEDQHRAVDDRQPQHQLQISKLDGGQLVVKHEDIRLARGGKQCELFRLAAADIGRSVYRAPALLLLGDDLDARGLAKLSKFAECIISVCGLNSRENRAVGLDLDDVIGVAQQPLVRLEDRVHELFLR